LLGASLGATVGTACVNHYCGINGCSVVEGFFIGTFMSCCASVCLLFDIDPHSPEQANRAWLFAENGVSLDAVEPIRSNNKLGDRTNWFLNLLHAME
jgi:hypothetical protein